MGSSRKQMDEDGVAETVSLAARRLASPAFANLFRQGMALIDETAAYLDGEGRTASRGLSRGVLAAYAQQSLQLSTRLMQLASWLLLRRAVLEGDMSEESALRESARIDLDGPRRDLDQEAELPAQLAALVRRSHELQRQIAKLDAALRAPVDAAGLRPNDVAGQIGKLRSAFERH